MNKAQRLIKLYEQVMFNPSGHVFYADTDRQRMAAKPASLATDRPSDTPTYTATGAKSTPSSCGDTCQCDNACGCETDDHYTIDAPVATSLDALKKLWPEPATLLTAECDDDEENGGDYDDDDDNDGDDDDGNEEEDEDDDDASDTDNANDDSDASLGQDDDDDDDDETVNSYHTSK